MKKSGLTHGKATALTALLLAVLLLALTACGAPQAADTAAASEVELTDMPIDAEPIEEAPDKNYVDLAALRELARQDNFALQITKKALVLNATATRDAIALTVTNNGNSAVSDIVICYVAYTSDRALIKWSDHGVDYTADDDPYVCSCVPDSALEIGAGQSERLSLNVQNTGDIAGVEAIVKSYKSEDGVQHINDCAQQWELRYALGRYSLSEVASVDAPADAQNSVDPDGLRAIEAKDTFDVRVVKKELVKSLKSVENSKNHCYLTVENQTGQNVSDVTIYLLIYAQDGVPVPSASSKIVRKFALNGELKAGASMMQRAEVRDVDEIAGMTAIVASYKTADGTEHKNPIADEWESACQAAEPQA